MANLILRDPYREIHSMNRALRRMIGDFYGRDDLGFEEPANFCMAMDVVENPDGFVVTADVAGIDPENIEITYTDNNLTIKGELLEEKAEQEGRYHLRERRHGAFSRTLSMPGAVDVSKIDAETKNGVLKIHLPKKEEVKPHRIQIKGGQSPKVINGKSK
jgi:HSP20 family protein